MALQGGIWHTQPTAPTLNLWPGPLHSALSALWFWPASWCLLVVTPHPRAHPLAAPQTMMWVTSLFHGFGYCRKIPTQSSQGLRLEFSGTCMTLDNDFKSLSMQNRQNQFQDWNRQYMIQNKPAIDADKNNLEGQTQLCLRWWLVVG